MKLDLKISTEGLERLTPEKLMEIRRESLKYLAANRERFALPTPMSFHERSPRTADRREATEVSEGRLGIISIPAKTIADLLGIGTDVRTELIDVLAWDQELTWGTDVEKVKRSVPIGEFRVISQEFNFESQSYRLLVHHSSLPPVPPGSLIPDLEVECRTRIRETVES